MKSYLKQYRPFFIFLLRFFLVYVMLTILYQAYLKNGLANVPDEFTKIVALQSKALLEILNYNVEIVLHPLEASYKIIIENVYVARVVEGCNAVSVAILFAAFVVAFKGRLIHTIVFIVAGTAIIHVLNILRIALLSIALLKYPSSEHLLHGIIFPLFIYGVVFVLWVVWVNRYSLYAGKNS